MDDVAYTNCLAVVDFFLTSRAEAFIVEVLQVGHYEMSLSELVFSKARMRIVSRYGLNMRSR